MPAPKRERLDLPRDTKFIAKLAGWTTDECRARLRALDEEMRGTLLTKIGTRYYVSLAHLRRHWPEFGSPIATPADIADIERQLAELQARERNNGAELRDLRRRVRKLEDDAAA